MTKHDEPFYARKATTAPTAIEVPQLSLSKGGGALKPIDDTFKVNAVTGTASLGLPLPITSARTAPSLSLNYDSGNGNGAFGLGWALDMPSISRRTDKQLPRYNDDDVFSLAGSEELVPMRREDGTPWEADVGGAHVTRYRPRIESGFALIERVAPPGGGMYWKTTTGGNQVTYFGLTAASRVSDPADPTRVVRWLPAFGHDDKGNVCVYDYKAEDGAPGPRSIDDRNRFAEGGAPRFAQRYLKRVRYGNREPWYASSPYAPIEPALTFSFELVFDYGEHGDGTPTAVPFVEDRPWSARADAHSDYRAGFEVRTLRLCRRVLMFHRFVELGVTPQLVRSLDLEYATSPLGEVTYLAASTSRGYTHRTDDVYDVTALPTQRFAYQPLAWQVQVHELAATDSVNLPEGLADNYRWVDLWNEGISGVLTEQAGALYYKRNLGGGQFSAARSLVEQPSLRGLANGGLAIADLDGDGRRQLVSPALGYFELDGESWQSFAAFEQIPNVDVASRNVLHIDLDGDGRPELLITEDCALQWYPSLGRAGYAPPETATKPRDEERGPALVWGDRTQRIFTADLSGDGLSDLVRVRDGEVCYWPNLGYGKFGDKVTMGGSPSIGEGFDPRRVQLADVTGTGAQDLLYLDGKRARVWINLAGNAWREAAAIELPDTVEPDRLGVVDLLGDGTPCVVWSSSRPGDAFAPLRYIDLFGGRKPHLLAEHANGFGKQITLAYRSSTRFYLDDARAGTPWRTKLPFPVQCVARVEIREQVTQSLLVKTYTYHHGYYDHVERELRGFGRVDEQDAETFAHWVKQGASNVVDERFHQPIVLTRTWFHTGAPPEDGDPLAIFAADYWHRNPALLALTTPEPEPALPPGRVPSGLTAEELREAYRACKGTTLRQEIFALDAPVEGAADAQLIAQLTPYSVALNDAHVELLQARGDLPHAAFLVRGRETLTLAYERVPADARVQHVLHLELDPYGNALRSASVVYGRKLAQAPVGVPAAVWTTQQRVHVTIAEHVYTDDELTAGPAPYRLPVECEAKTFELVDPPPTTGLYTIETLAAAANLRLLKHSRIAYLADDLASPRPFGKPSPLGLPYESYQLAFTTPGLREVIDTSKLSDADLETVLVDRGHYVRDGDDWWIPSGTIDLLDAARAPQRFYSAAAYRDPRGATTEVTYLGEDATRTNVTAHWGLLGKTRDAVGNQASVAAFDFRVMAPAELVDLNGNRTGVVFDDVGRPIASATLGKGGDADSLDALRARLADRAAQAQNAAQFFAQGDDESAAWLLADATSRWIYDHSAMPLRGASITRERHVRDLADTGDPLALQIAVEYTGGAGNQVVKKVKSGGGQWIATGRSVVNNKGKPIQQFEPYMTSTHEFEPGQLLVDTGVSPLITYDSAGRHVRTDYPDGTFDFTRFDAWSQELHDPNDTVLASAWFAARSALAANDPERLAAEQTAMHDGTPLVLHLDSLGRQVCSVAHHRGKDADDNLVETFPTLFAEIDPEGNLLAVLDARGNAVIEHAYDQIGRGIRSTSPEAGERWSVYDIAGVPLLGWDSRGSRLRHVYDQVHRPTEQWLSIAGASEMLVVMQRWGEDAPDAAARNLRGQLWKLYDHSGLFETVSHDLHGNRTESTRRFTATYDEFIAWPAADPDVLLEPEAFRTRGTYDALGRPLRMTSPVTPAMTPSEIVLAYEPGGHLSRVVGSVRGGPSTTFVDSITYNEKGQRLAIRYGNGTRVEYAYDPRTFRLERATTTRGANDVLQDLHYTYDPSANVIAQRDDAQQATYFGGSVAAPAAWYEYDSLYRLVRARGREHIGQNGPADEWDSGRSRQILPGDAQAMQPYEERYEYDVAGNITRLRHAAQSGGGFVNRWTRDYEYAGASNRLMSTTVGNQTTPYAYNPHGSMQTMPHLQLMAWDPYERLVHVRQGTLDAYYNYDDQGRRTRKVVEKGAVREVRLYLGPFELFRRYRSGVLELERESQHVMDDHRRIALVETRTVGDDDAPPQLVRYQLDNHLRSAVLELDHAGDVISYEEYHPFGTTAWQAGRSAAEVSLKRYRYCGLERDEESGLGCHGARYYAPWLARWTAVDPIGLGDGPNVYAYATNSPVTLYDPNGTEGQKPNENDRVIMQMTDPELYRFMSGLEPRLQQAFAAGATGAFAARAQAMVQKYNLQNVQITSKTRRIGETAPYKEQGRANYVNIFGSSRRADEAEHALATAGAKVLLDDASNKWKRESPTIVLAESQSRIKTPTDNQLTKDFKEGKITAEQWLQQSTTNAYRSWFEARALGVPVPTAEEFANAIIQQKTELLIRYYTKMQEQMEQIQAKANWDANAVNRFQGMTQIRLDQTADAQAHGHVRTSIMVGGAIVLGAAALEGLILSGAVVVSAPVVIGSVPATGTAVVVGAGGAEATVSSGAALGTGAAATQGTVGATTGVRIAIEGVRVSTSTGIRVVLTPSSQVALENAMLEEALAEEAMKQGLRVMIIP